MIDTSFALKDAKGTKLVLLSTAAGPIPGRSREMTSHVMLSNGSAYVLDCGMGVTDQFISNVVVGMVMRDEDRLQRAGGNAGASRAN